EGECGERKGNCHAAPHRNPQGSHKILLPAPLSMSLTTGAPARWPARKIGPHFFVPRPQSKRSHSGRGWTESTLVHDRSDHYGAARRSDVLPDRCATARHALWLAQAFQDRKSTTSTAMAPEIVPHFHNTPGVPAVEIAAPAS